MKSAKAKAMGLGGALFVAVYVPAFIATALVRPRIELAIALIIAISLLIAILLIFLSASARSGFAEFGSCIPSSRYLGIACASGLTSGFVAAFLIPLFPLKPPFDVSGFVPWKIGLYFIVGASVQEEVIFRGLIQSMVEARWAASFRIRSTSISGAVAFTAALFGVVHLAV